MVKLPAPRILPLTITTIALLLVVKCGTLLQAVVTNGQRPGGVMVATANAAGPEKDQPTSAPVHSPPLGSPPADAPKSDPVHSAAVLGPSASGVPTHSERPAASEGPPPVSDSEKAILQDLRQRRKEIESRETTVVTRESMLTAAEQKLGARVGEMQVLQRKLEGLDAAQKQKEDAGWQAMVKLYEAMKPKEAAAILDELPMPVLLPLMDRMKPAKAAAVMAAMTPEKARDVTSELAQMRTGQDASSSGSDPNPKPNPVGG
jgi:flagellar motility protein MotE (MotC chaperone)